MLILFLRTLSHYLITFFPDYYISELLLSFLPYSMIGHYIAILICLAMIIRRRRRLSKINRLAHLCLYTLIYLSYLTTSTYLSTYSDDHSDKDEKPTIQNGETKTTLSFLYANILYTNTNTAGLLKTIHETNPDIIMMVEYADHQDQAMRANLLNDYPYTSHYKPLSRKGYDGDIIYSRYPLTRVKTTDSPRAYNHVTITKNQKKYNIVLVHTAAPVSISFWRLRRRQMNTLTRQLEKFTKKNGSNTVTVFGDFNITPWADAYHDFDTKMTHLGMTDKTTDLSSLKKGGTLWPMALPGSLTTWGHKHLPIARAHIDHFWAGKDITTSYRIIDIPGSDHDGFVGILNQ